MECSFNNWNSYSWIYDNKDIDKGENRMNEGKILKIGDIIFNTETEMNERVVEIDKKSKTYFTEDANQDNSEEVEK